VTIDDVNSFNPLENYHLSQKEAEHHAFASVLFSPTLDCQSSKEITVSTAISLEHVSKKFRLYHEKNQYLKTTLLRGGRSHYEDFWAVQDVSFEIPTGSTFGIIGSNGSGKSTLLKCLAGILSPDKGRINVNGRLSALLELGAGFHPELSGRENIFLNGAILGMTQKEVSKRFDDIVDFSGLGHFIDTPVKNYSSGMVVRLGFSIATNVEPEILLIDEVLAVGDAEFQQRCYEKIERFRQDGRTIVLVSHGLTQIEQLCDTVAWLEKSRLKVLGPALEVVQKYNGASHHAIQREEDEIGDRWGSGEALITKVELLKSDCPTSLFNTNKEMKIRVHYNAPTGIDDVVVGVRITQLHGMNVWGTNTKRKGVQIDHLFGSGHIDLEIDSLPLLTGTYDLTVALSNLNEVSPFDHWEKRIRFDVLQQDTFDEGTVNIDSIWKTN
jgi:ABC-2 type transport system ATP-binding protein